MPSTHLALTYHVVFSTKNRARQIHSSWRERFHAYLGGAVRTLEGSALAVGGTEDHVHLAIGLKATHRLADVMRELKAVSSRWVHEEIGPRDFAWQEGYGAFTVSPDHLKELRRYIAGQEEHHRTRTFQEEYLELLREHGFEYDERYLW